jgi:5-methylcytosine-specific restriction endonuclease McrA
MISDFTYELLLKKYGSNKCNICGRLPSAEIGHKSFITIDHIIPKSKGGKSHISNYQFLCKECNNKKADKFIDWRDLV